MALRDWDTSWSARVRWPFRVASLMLSIVFLAGGIARVFDLIREPPETFDLRVKTLISWSGMGLACLIVALRGSLTKRKM